MCSKSSQLCSIVLLYVSIGTIVVDILFVWKFCFLIM